MAKYCAHCGSPLKEDAKFCPGCGFPVNPAQSAEHVQPAPPQIMEQAAAEAEPQTRYTAKSLTLKKRIYIPIIAVIVIVGALFFIGKTMADPQRTIDAFKNAVQNQDVHTLAGLVHTNGNMPADRSQIKAMLALFQKQPGIYTNVLHSFQQSIKSADTQSGSSSPYYLEKSGKKFFIFNNYQIRANLIHPLVITNLKGMQVGIEGVGKAQTAAQASANSPETLTLAGVIPGYYTIYGKSSSMNTSVQEAIHSAGVKVDFSGIYIPVRSNISDAELYVNGKDTGKTLAQVTEWGPFKENDSPSFYAKYTVNGQSIQTDSVNISDSSYDGSSLTLDQAENDGIDLTFDESGSDNFYVLDRNDSGTNRNTLNSYFSNFFDALGTAVSSGDTSEFASYFETDTDFSNMQIANAKKFNSQGISESNQSFDITNIQYIGKDTFSMDVSEAWNESYTDQNDNFVNKDFTLKSNYQVKETAPGQLKIVGQKITDRQELN
ncbi:zinc-ribbon domain-containing protein [Sporolactobacillus sp. CQH2019]|uniref:zinc ribbon domain-containing protein n=1 Tax=Sporolactobacillus sp. CQH2019 TaxID=3023512 RepID=UPI002367C42C|nr:zinc-ribbon domain-containing protein [Sporolactobacillus sp. CQH2019]MDD9148013.1 zinc-ribbon domain-containing protein [Sporolactobacillus sp. CQH2019]